MKIGILVRDLVQEGGGERQLLELAVRMQGKGHVVTIYTCVYEPQHCYPNLSQSLRIISTGPSWLRRLPRPFFTWDVFLQWVELRSLTKQVAPDLDVLNPHPYLAYAAACQIKRRTGIPVVYHSNDVYLLPHQSRWMAESNSSWRTALSRWARWPWRTYERACYRYMDRILVSAQWLKESLKDLYGVEARVIPAGVNIDTFKPGPRDEALRTQYGLRADEVLLFSMNSILPHRRYEDTIQAVALLRKQGVPVTYWIGGKAANPAYFEFLKKQVRDAGLDPHIRFLGPLPESDIQRYYLASDLYVFAAEWESWSLSVTEAMACQKPVLLSRTSGNDEVFEDRRHAMLFTPRRPDELAQKISELIQDPALCENIAASGCQLVRNTYTWDHYADAVLQEFESVVPRRKRAAVVPLDRPQKVAVS